MSTTAASASACPSCHSGTVRPILEADGIPVHCNVLFADPDTAVDCARGDLRLMFCENCGLIFNAAFDSELTSYSESYENSLYYSPTFRAYAEKLAERLVEDHGLRDKQIVEIGCGSAEFLNSLCELGNNRGLGFDPSAPPSRYDRVSIVNAFYGPEHAGYEADAIVARHVLEHVLDPGALLSQIRAAVGKGTVFYCEVPNARFILEGLSVWDIIYEHPTYFSTESLAWALSAGGFTVDRMEATFDNQFLSVDATAGDTGSVIAPLNDLTHLVDEFEVARNKKVQFWSDQCVEWHRAGASVALWGTGSKGVTFLNMISAPNSIGTTVDKNPRKHGKHLPGTGHRVVAPTDLADAPPDIVLVMNPAYRGEIVAELAAMELDPEVLVV